MTSTTHHCTRVAHTHTRPFAILPSIVHDGSWMDWITLCHAIALKYLLASAAEGIRGGVYSSSGIRFGLVKYCLFDFIHIVMSKSVKLDFWLR